jgi:hypothetical protein
MQAALLALSMCGCGDSSAAGTNCIHNSEQADTTSCTAAGAPECRRCYAQTQACLMDGV